MKSIENAPPLINTSATGDTEKAASLHAEGHIEHNSAYGTGRDAFASSAAVLALAPVRTTGQNIRALVRIFLCDVLLGGAPEKNSGLL
ncbi:MAG: hypothetical protein IJ242_11685 [Clostridia bacterium]|nr:hypothetical protein [Clostridia bacterium]